MMGTTLQRSKTTRESKVRTLVFFLTLSVLIHGTFYPREWLLLGAGMVIFNALTLKNSSTFQISLTDIVFTGLIALSFVGLLNPVNVSEGWLDAVRWLVLWMAYRISSNLQEGQSRYVLRWIEGIGILIAIIGWIPAFSRLWPGGTSVVDGRLASFFGYPNALAAYCAAVLLLGPQSKWIRALMFTSLLNTGSRGAVGIFILVWVCREALLWKSRSRQTLERGKRSFQRFPRGFLRGLGEWRLLRGNKVNFGIVRARKEGVLLILLLSLGVLLTLRWNQQVVVHLLNWGISTSLGERLLYIHDGLHLAVLNKGLPRAGGWYAFPIVQNIPYWTTDPHSLGIRILLHQGILGILLAGGWGAWAFAGLIGEALRKLRENSEKNLTFIRGFSALLFLAMHALLDTDFLFGALGLLFWTLFGIFSLSTLKKWSWRKNSTSIESYYTQKRGDPVKKGISFLSSALLLGIGGLLLATAAHPQWIERGDQIQPKMRQEAARLEIEQSGSNGLVAIENILAWEKFDLRMYEWAQGIVFEEAEKRKVSNFEEAVELYRWVENVPGRITSIHQISAFEKKLWPEAESFQPSEYNLLLAEYARKRQITLR